MTTLHDVVAVPTPRQPTDRQPRPACVDAPVNAFFRADHEYKRDALKRLTRTARRYCGHCPILDQCGAAADRYDAEGVWGGVARMREKNLLVRYELLGRFTVPSRTEGGAR